MSRKTKVGRLGNIGNPFIRPPFPAIAKTRRMIALYQPEMGLSGRAGGLSERRPPARQRKIITQVSWDRGSLPQYYDLRWEHLDAYLSIKPVTPNSTNSFSWPQITLMFYFGFRVFLQPQLFVFRNRVIQPISIFGFY